MIKMLLRVVGVLLIAGSLAAAWIAYGNMDEIQKLEMEVYHQRAEKAHTQSPEKVEERIAESEQGIEEKTTQRNVWFGVAGVGLVVGLGLVLLPSSRKRKVLAAAPPPAWDAPGS